MDTTYSQVLVRPYVTEKTEKSQGASKYSFIVNPSANKVTIKNAVAKLYNTVVKSVNVTPIRKKIRKVGRTKWITKRQAEIKAVVTLEKGKSIDPLKMHAEVAAQKKKATKSSK
ncbi:50S ribosomal protein L23 [Candidatus Peregrinibacteria bacterium]|jgi:large subunit ribosomal protein L23|nr:50S ribosomal protein L23 [Candidatus Peregrinibacteria bacterium]